MNPDLQRLIQLQRTETELRRLEAELAELPRAKQELEAALAAERGRLEAAREGLAACQKARRQHEGELQDLETKRSRYKGQLMDVKTNKEYTAMLHEIEGVEREIRAREDQVLAEMERAEALAAEIKTEEELFRAAERRHADEGKRLDERAHSLGDQAGKARAERDAVAASIPEESLALFQRVAKLRGTGVAEAREEACQLCHVKLRPQMFVDLKRNEAILQCPSCSRILYFEPPAPVVVPQP
jgi:predicted  nucleic acid-binding Zn-ribbon protein